MNTTNISVCVRNKGDCHFDIDLLYIRIEDDVKTEIDLTPPSCIFILRIPETVPQM